MRGIWVGPTFAPSSVDVHPPPPETSMDRIAVDVEREGIAGFGIDLTWLTPTAVRDASVLGLGIWSVWPYDQSSSSGRRDGRNATDIALTLHQPAGSAIYFPDPPEDAEPDYWTLVDRVLGARGFELGYHGLMPPRAAAYRWGPSRAHIVTGPRHPLGILCDIPRDGGLWNLRGTIKPPRRRLLSRSGA